MRTLWFGTRGFERWVKMVRIDMERGQYGWSNSASHVSGGKTIHRSTGGHQEYAMEWRPLTGREARDIQDFLDGQYDTDENRGLLHFVLPDAQRTNAFSQVWAAPHLSAAIGGAPTLVKDHRPTLTPTPANSLHLPARSAVFNVVDGASRLRFYAPIPPGHVAHWAFYGPSSQVNAIEVTTYTAGVADAPSNEDTRDIDDYGTLAAVSGKTGIEFALAEDSGSVTLTTALLQILPAGSSPGPFTAWESGQGHSGCYVEGDVGQTLKNTTHDREARSARLVEQGSWL